MNEAPVAAPMLITPQQVEAACAAKLARARQHERSLMQQMHLWEQSNVVLGRPEFVHLTPLGQKNYTLVMDVRPPFPTNDLAAVLGDLAHNLRSCLDQLAFGLVAVGEARQGLTSDALESIGFPLFKRQARNDSSSKRARTVRVKLPGVSQQVADVALSLAPQLGGSKGSTRMAISMLNSLNIGDKHLASARIRILGKFAERNRATPRGARVSMSEYEEVASGRAIGDGVASDGALPAPFELGLAGTRAYIAPGFLARYDMEANMMTHLLIERTAYVVSLLTPALFGRPLPAGGAHTDFGADETSDLSSVIYT